MKLVKWLLGRCKDRSALLNLNADLDPANSQHQHDICSLDVVSYRSQRYLMRHCVCAIVVLFFMRLYYDGVGEAGYIGYF